MYSSSFFINNVISWIGRYYIYVPILLLTACNSLDEDTIKVGVLHSLTGTMAVSEKSVVDATLMAIDEINAQGGVLGRHLEAIVMDGQSDPEVFAEHARTLIQEKNIDVIFGCWTSASRKAVKPIVEEFDSLLFYPVQYEGLETSPNIVYTGATPNQQITPTVRWGVTHFGLRAFLVGSDYIFPRTANLIIKKQLSALKSLTVGEHYIPLGGKDVSELMKAIKASDADFILNTINGDSNITFFEQLKKHNITVPVISFSLAEDEVQLIDTDAITGHYSAWSYFQSIDSDYNRLFVKAFKNKYGQQRTTNASMQAGYLGVHLWKQAVIYAQSTDSAQVKNAVSGVTIEAPEGLVLMSHVNNHLWKPLYIGQVQRDKQFKLIWQHKIPIRPIPFPRYRTITSWNTYLDSLHRQWQGRWSAPVEPNKGLL